MTPSGHVTGLCGNCSNGKHDQCSSCECSSCALDRQKAKVQRDEKQLRDQQTGERD